MIPELIPDAIRINARPELRLRPGDFVSIRVIRRIVGTKYAVALRGRVIPAFSKLDLVPGRTLNVLVARAGDRFELRIADEKPNQVLELLRREGLGTDKATAAIVAAMLRTGLAVRSETLQRISGILRRLRLDPGRFSRLIAMLVDKKLDLSETLLEKLVALLSYGEGRGSDAGGGRRRRQEGKPGRREELASLLRAAVEREEQEGENVLQLFNHLPASRECWIVVPYGFGCQTGSAAEAREEFSLRGTLRLRYRKPARTLNRLVLTAAAGGRLFGFVLDGEGEPLRLTAFASRTAPGAAPGVFPGWQKLRTNLQNLGVEVDDTIREDSGFDGFSLPWEEIPYQSVNTQG